MQGTASLTANLLSNRERLSSLVPVFFKQLFLLSLYWKVLTFSSPARILARRLAYTRTSHWSSVSFHWWPSSYTYQPRCVQAPRYQMTCTTLPLDSLLLHSSCWRSSSHVAGGVVACRFARSSKNLAIIHQNFTTSSKLIKSSSFIAYSDYCFKIIQYMGKKQRNIDVCKKLRSSSCYFWWIKLAKIRFKLVYNRCLRWICSVDLFQPDERNRKEMSQVLSLFCLPRAR